MLSLILVAASFLPATGVPVQCAHTASVETETARGPIGTSALVKVATQAYRGAHSSFSQGVHKRESSYRG
jgi:hypothetical protein